MIFKLFKNKFISYIILVTFTMAFFMAPKLAYAAAGDGLLVYGEEVTDIGQNYRTWTGSSSQWGNETNGPVNSVITNWTVLKASPVADDSGNVPYVMAMVKVTKIM